MATPQIYHMPENGKGHGICFFSQQTPAVLQHFYIAQRCTMFLLMASWMSWQIPGSHSQFSPSVVSNSLWMHESQHARPPCPSPTPGVHPNSCALSQWCHPVISSSVIPFSSCPQSLPATGSFPMSRLFASGGQSIEFQPQHQYFRWTPRTGLL